MITGYDNPMKNQDDSEIGVALGLSLSVCAEIYCGIKEDTLNKAVLIECTKFVYRHYRDLGLKSQQYKMPDKIINIINERTYWEAESVFGYKREPLKTGT